MAAFGLAILLDDRFGGIGLERTAPRFTRRRTFRDRAGEVRWPLCPPTPAKKAGLVTLRAGPGADKLLLPLIRFKLAYRK
jgi:hypothetical protein